MRSLKLAVIMLCVMTMASGCLWRKKSNNLEGSVALYDYPLDKFVEPKSEELKLALKDIYFDYNSSVLTSEAQSKLNGVVGLLRLSPNKYLHLLVEGHCDERGSNEYNLALGEQRALKVRKFIIDGGIDAKRIQTISYGEEKPIDAGHDEKAWKKNRRGHFLVAE